MPPRSRTTRATAGPSRRPPADSATDAGAPRRSAERTRPHTDTRPEVSAGLVYDMLDRLRAGVTIHDRAGTIRYANHAIVELLGTRAEDLIGGSFERAGTLFIEHTGVPFAIEAAIGRAAASGQPVHGLYQCIHRSGHRRWVQFDATPGISQGGAPLVLCTFAETASRQDTLEALRRVGDRYRRLLDTAYEGIWQANERGITVFVNQRLADMLGYQPAEMVGRPIHYFLDEEMRPRFEARFEQRRKGVTEQFELRFLRRNGAPLWALVSAAPVFESDRFAGSLAMIMDVTDRKQGEEAIRLNESRYRSLVIASATIVWTASPKGAGLTGAHSWAEYTGQPPHESAGWGWVDAVHADDRDAARDAWVHALSSTTPLNTVYRVRRRDGEYRYVAATGVPVLADDGSVREWVGMVRDVHAEHALRESEQEARRLREELHRVSAVAMLSTMVASIAHDVAQPLTAIDANAKTLLRYASRSSAFGDFREALRDIVSDTARARELLERPRRHLRTGTVKKRPLSMNATVTDVVRVLRRSADDAGIRVVTHLAPSLPLFMGDSLEVQQVLVNILMNAFESEALVPDARRTVTVRTWAFDGQVAVSVADNGEGVTDEQLEHMFEPLYTSKPHGMGLGLAICKVIVEEHGGTIAATRNETDGITLAVAVPAAPPPVEGSPARA